MKRIAAILLLCIAGLLLAGCPRDLERAGYSAVAPTYSYPWDKAQREEQSAQDPAADEEQYEVPAVAIPKGEHWPDLSPEDSLDEMRLSGRWLRVAFMDGERIRLLEPELIDHLELRETGTFTITYPANAPGGQPPPLEGNWGKAGPGLFELTPLGGESLTLNAELFRGDFLFFWNAKGKQSFWYVRVQPEAAERIKANRWDTSLGEMRIGNVMQDRFDFEVVSSTTRSGTGYYADGILRLRWEDVQTDAGGYAALIVSPDWRSLKGVWWIDDYEAAPFGGAWDSLSDAPLT